MKDGGSNPLEHVMKKLLDEITDWVGWFFVEVSVKMHRLSNYNWAWDTAKEEYHWFLRPYGWLADASYSLGNFFYALGDSWWVRKRN